MNTTENAEQQRDAVADGEETDVQCNVLEPVEKENYPHEEENMIVAGDHMFRSKVQERPNGSALVGLHELGISLRDVVRACDGRQQQGKCNYSDDQCGYFHDVLPNSEA